MKNILSIRKICKLFSGLYRIVSVISTLAIFSGSIIYIYGMISNNNMSDNDLIMRQINEELENGERIESITTDDIHGFGKNSIIVTSSNFPQKYGENSNARFIIMETVENEILNNMNNLFGTNSEYKTTFSYNLISQGLIPKTNIVMDIVGDDTKEIIIDYECWGSTFGAYYSAIFMYSYEKMQYELIGTYPVVRKENLQHCIIVDNYFNKMPDDEYHYNNFTDSFGNTFNLTSYSYYCRDYWMKLSSTFDCLVVFEFYKTEPRCLVNIYQTYYRDGENSINWNLMYSEYVETSKDLNFRSTKNELAKCVEEITGQNVIEVYPSRISWK